MENEDDECPEELHLRVPVGSSPSASMLVPAGGVVFFWRLICTPKK
jgi:hypothetical protein